MSPERKCRKEDTRCENVAGLILRVFWDITLYSPLKIYRHFGDTYRIYFQDLKIILWFPASFFGPEDRGDMILQNVGLTFRGFQSFILQKV
jgi:hypothetical protein